MILYIVHLLSAIGNRKPVNNEQRSNARHVLLETAFYSNFSHSSATPHFSKRDDDMVVVCAYCRMQVHPLKSYMFYNQFNLSLDSGYSIFLFHASILKLEQKSHQGEYLFSTDLISVLTLSYLVPFASTWKSPQSNTHWICRSLVLCKYIIALLPFYEFDFETEKKRSASTIHEACNAFNVRNRRVSLKSKIEQMKKSLTFVSDQWCQHTEFEPWTIITITSYDLSYRVRTLNHR